MAKSQNGWTASPDLKTRVIKPVPGLSLRIVDNDNVAVIFDYICKQFDSKIEKIVGGVMDDWGFAYRPNRNDPNSLSNHSSGTAIDLNATQHPNGVKTARTFSAEEIAKIHKMLDELDGVVRWGGDYKGTPDSMHFEINVPPSSPKVAALAKKLKAKEDGPAQPKPPVVKYEKLESGTKPGKRSAQVKRLQRYLILAGYGPISGAYTTYYGENTENAVARFHKKNPEFSDPKPYDSVIGPKGFEELQKQAAKKK